jgi:hypothetical protein
LKGPAPIDSSVYLIEKKQLIKNIHRRSTVCGNGSGDMLLHSFFNMCGKREHFFNRSCRDI